MTRLVGLAAVALAAAVLLPAAARPLSAQLTVTKSAPRVIEAHDTFEYTIKVANTGDVTLYRVNLTDTFPDQVAIKNVSSSRRDFPCSLKDKTLFCGYATLKGKGDSATVQVTVQDNAEGLTSFKNTANARSSDPVRTASDTATVIVAGTDLAVSKTGPAQVQVGDVVGYTVTVQNKGQYPARGAVLTDELPAQLASISAPGCTIANTTATCALGDVAAGDTKTFQIGGIAAATGQATDKATAATTTSETDHSNDSATFTTTIVPKPPPPKRTSDLAITMKTTPSSLLVGSKVKYTIVVTNKGPVAAPATITDKLPAAMHFVSVSKPCTQKAGIVTCKLGTLAVGKKSKPVTLQVLAVGVGTVINTATVTGGKDPVTTNNISKVRNLVRKKPTVTTTTPTTTTAPTTTAPTTTAPPPTTTAPPPTTTAPPPTTTAPTTTATTTTTPKPKPKPKPKPAGHPKLVLVPAVGPPGSVTHATGTGFAPNKPVDLAWTKGTGGTTVTADSKGRFTVSLVLYDGDVLGPRQLVASPAKVSARFLVALRALQPPMYRYRG